MPLSAKALIVVLLAVLAAGQALGQGGIVAQYGGQTAESGGWNAEFAVRDGMVRLWLRDQAGKPVKASGKVTLLLGGPRLELDLVPSGDGLAAQAPVQAADKLAAVLNLEVAGKPLTLRFMQGQVTTPASLPPQAEAGRQAFGANCAPCHGHALRGSDTGPPLLHPLYAPGSAHGDEVILAAINKGAKTHMWKFGDMPRPQGLKPGQDREILAYLRAMQAANGISAPAGPDPHAGHGKHAHH